MTTLLWMLLILMGLISSGIGMCVEVYEVSTKNLSCCSVYLGFVEKRGEREVEQHKANMFRLWTRVVDKYGAWSIAAPWSVSFATCYVKGAQSVPRTASNIKIL